MILASRFTKSISPKNPAGLPSIRRALALHRRLHSRSMFPTHKPSLRSERHPWGSLLVKIGDRSEYADVVKSFEFLTVRSDSAGATAAGNVKPASPKQELLAAGPSRFQGVQPGETPFAFRKLGATRFLTNGEPRFFGWRPEIGRESFSPGAYFTASSPTRRGYAPPASDNEPLSQTVPAPASRPLQTGRAQRMSGPDHPEPEVTGAKPKGMGNESSPDNSWSFWASRSRAAPLGIVSRVFLERILPGTDLAGMRIHTDASADRAARLLGAEAFSWGQDIFFRAGRFNPATGRGMALLGHELVHAGQMAEGLSPQSVFQRDRLEREALNTEAHLLKVFPMAGLGQDVPLAGPFMGSARHYGPVDLKLGRSESAWPGDRTGLSSRNEHSLSVDAGLAHRAAQPLKAEAGRDVSAPSGMGAAEASPAAGADPERLAREIFRSLTRNIQIEKERRGVDRWQN